MFKTTGVKLDLISDIYMYKFIEKQWEEVFLIYIRNIVKHVINTWNNMMIVSQVNILLILMKIIYIVVQ